MLVQASQLGSTIVQHPPPRTWGQGWVGRLSQPHRWQVLTCHIANLFLKPSPSSLIFHISKRLNTLFSRVQVLQ